jgi:predicted TIM-barrel enzyme
MDFNKKPILGMIHMYGQEQAADYADKEIDIFEQEGVDGFILENYHGGLKEIRQVLGWIDEIPGNMLKGINILPNDIVTAYELAAAYKLDFIQFDYVAGSYERTAPFDYQNFWRFRTRFPEIKILGGVWPKYYEPVKSSNLSEDIIDAQNNCDAIVVTGAGTGKETPLDKIMQFKRMAGTTPIIIGAGLTPQNVAEQLIHADGAIVGSTFKKFGKTTNPVDRELVREFMAEVNKLRVV